MGYIQQSIFDLTEFDDIKHLSKNGVEFWLARDLQNILQYNEWRNFVKVINKAKIACEKSGNVIENHFVDANKMVLIGSGTEREIEDIKLSRYACYLIVQNADARKKVVAQGQSYFAIQTRHYLLLLKIMVYQTLENSIMLVIKDFMGEKIWLISRPERTLVKIKIY